MGRFIGKRLLQTLLLLFLVSIISFAVLEAAPADIMTTYTAGKNYSPEQVETLRRQLGMDGNVLQRYVSWLVNLLHGNLGVSLISHQPVLDELWVRLGATLLLMGVSLVLSLLLSIPLGLTAGCYKDRWQDNIISFFTYIGISLPAFWFALLLLILFAQGLGWLPSNGMRTPGLYSAADLLRHLILPSIVMSVSNTAVFTKYIRSNTIEQLEEDYVLTAISKGLRQRSILFRHILKNCLLPIITLVGMNLGTLVTGSIIVESIFSWPGMGTMGLSAVNSRDYPMIMAFTMISCVMLVLGNLLADILYHFADPRIQIGKETRLGINK